MYGPYNNTVSTSDLCVLPFMELLTELITIVIELRNRTVVSHLNSSLDKIKMNT